MDVFREIHVAAAAANEIQFFFSSAPSGTIRNSAKFAFLASPARFTTNNTHFARARHRFRR
jgi:hypothetical protein